MPDIAVTPRPGTPGCICWAHTAAPPTACSFTLPSLLPPNTEVGARLSSPQHAAPADLESPPGVVRLAPGPGEAGPKKLAQGTSPSLSRSPTGMPRCTAFPIRWVTPAYFLTGPHQPPSHLAPRAVRSSPNHGGHQGEHPLVAHRPQSHPGEPRARAPSSRA